MNSPVGESRGGTPEYVLPPPGPSAAEGLGGGSAATKKLRRIRLSVFRRSASFAFVREWKRKSCRARAGTGRSPPPVRRRRGARAPARRDRFCFAGSEAANLLRPSPIDSSGAKRRRGNGGACPILTASKVELARRRVRVDAALINVPSPLAGEGCSAIQQREWVRGRWRRTPHRRRLLDILRCPLPQGERAL
jgi:hypothetical protein